MSFTSDKASPILLKGFSKVYRIFYQLIYLIIEQDDPEIGPALYSIVFAGKVEAYHKWNTIQVLHSRVGSWPCPQTIGSAGKARQEPTLEWSTWKVFHLW